MDTMELNEMEVETSNTHTPCQFTVEELKSEIRRSEEAVKQNLLHTMEEMRAIHPR
jgi:hypothetical protein